MTVTEIPQALAKLDRARVMLAEVRGLPEIKKIGDLAEAARTYAKAAHLSRETINYAGEIKVLADVKAGELLEQLERGKTGPKKLPPSVSGNSEYAQVLKDTKTPPSTARYWQKAAKIQGRSVGASKRNCAKRWRS